MTKHLVELDEAALAVLGDGDLCDREDAWRRPHHHGR